MSERSDRRPKRKLRVPTLIDRHFRWLNDRGFEVVESSEAWGPSATYASSEVLVRPSYEERDDYPDITVARRPSPSMATEPYWAQVHLHELLEARAPGLGVWPPREGTRSAAAIDKVLARGALLLQTQADDLLDGRNLEVLDDIIAKRPRLGVPGFDFPVDEPWFASAEGFWFTTDSDGPADIETHLERSRSADPRVRAVAALKIAAAMGGASMADAAAADDRLHELLDDPEPDVRRAAASTLGQLPDAHALTKLVSLLDAEPADGPTPIASAITFIALDLPAAGQEQALEALRRFAARGAAAAAQVDDLAWRLGDGEPRGYPRTIRLWRGPDDAS